MVVAFAAGYIAGTLLQERVIIEITKRLAGKASEKSVRLKGIDKLK